MKLIKQSYITSNCALKLSILLLMNLCRVSSININLKAIEPEAFPTLFSLQINKNIKPFKFNFDTTKCKFSYSEQDDSSSNSTLCTLELIIDMSENSRYIKKAEGNKNLSEQENGDFIFYDNPKNPFAGKMLESHDQKICLKLEDLKATNIKEALTALLNLKEQFGKEIQLGKAEVKIIMTPIQLTGFEFQDIYLFENEFSQDEFIRGSRIYGNPNHFDEETIFSTMRKDFENKSDNILKRTFRELKSFCSRFKPYKQPCRISFHFLFSSRKLSLNYIK